MASTPQARLKRDVPSGSEGRHPPLHILFVHSHIAEVERCLQVLNKMHFTVSAEIVGTPEEFSKRLGAHAYDLVVAEYPSPDWRETQALELLHLSNRQIPLIFVSSTLQRETVAEFITKGAYDCIEMGRIGHLPVAVHRALQEKALREECGRAQNGLRHSEARYQTAPVGGSSASTGGPRPADRTGQLPPSRGSTGYGNQAFRAHRAGVCPVVI